MSSNHSIEISSGQRFEFGKNWARFLSVVNEHRIDEAEQSLQRMTGARSLAGCRFLDAGAGSGLFSLAARRLGARVHSFDYDPRSVACTQELKRRYSSEDQEWTVESGSMLDKPYLDSLGEFEIVYSWGVLHHTGAMWTALDNIRDLVAPGGKLCISIYNDQGVVSRRWLAVKRTYNRAPIPVRFFLTAAVFMYSWGPVLIKDCLRLKPFHSWRNYGGGRGMAAWSDLLDWVGGYPFEVARPEAIFRFYRDRGFQLMDLQTSGNLGCNEFVFRKALVDGAA